MNKNKIRSADDYLSWNPTSWLHESYSKPFTPYLVNDVIAAQSAATLENGDAEITINALGISPDDINISVSGDTLTINSDVDGTALVQNIDLSYTLFDVLDGTKTKAKYKHGLLVITIPLSESKKPIVTKIEIT